MRALRSMLAAGLVSSLFIGQQSSAGQTPSASKPAANPASAGQAEFAQSTVPHPARDYPVKPVPFTAVHFDDAFWAPRIEINRTVTIPFAFQKDEDTGRIRNFERAAAALRGEDLKD